MPSAADANVVTRAWTAFRDQFRALFHEVAKFGAVGLVALVVDIGLFNLLRFAGGQGPMYDRPISAKIISVAAATVVAYFGNRYWTWRDRGRTHMSRELLMFFLLNAVGMLISVACLWISHYALGLTSALADNLSANVIGLGLGTLFRFWSYRKWVFPELPDDAVAHEIAERDASTLI
ncbi:MAG: GtrA family protein [Candidatus Nanopelagicales bacterium]|nr:GtrA family protein [Candidatus Nanopelagicales bacterium]